MDPYKDCSEENPLYKHKEWVKRMTVHEVVEILVKARVPVAPVLNLEEVINDPHTLAREMIIEVDHPVVGKVKMPGFPIKFSKTPVIIKNPAPLLGEHTEKVLTSLLSYKKRGSRKTEGRRSNIS